MTVQAAGIYFSMLLVAIAGLLAGTKSPGWGWFLFCGFLAATSALSWHP